MSCPLIIKSKLLSGYPEIRHGISTRGNSSVETAFGFNLSYRVGDDEKNVTSNRMEFYGELGISERRIAFQRQIHSDTIIEVSKPGIFEECDGLMTNVPELYLTITIADCIPILVYDPVKRCVAAIHSGWKGTQKNIARRAIEMMHERFGSKPSDLICFIGPGASECCYNVGQEVTHQFSSTYLIQRGGKIFLDLKRIIHDSVRAEGVLEKFIEISPSCTICEPLLFQSYRRDGIKSGRMLGIIGFRE
jgi:polyphenol oxidase